MGLQGLKLFIDLFEVQIADLGCMLSEPLEGCDGILVVGHLHPALSDRPTEESVQDLAVSVGRGRFKTFGINHTHDEVGDVPSGDCFEAGLLDDPYGPLAFLDGLLVVSGSVAVLGVLKLLTALSIGRTEVLDISLCAFFGFGCKHLPGIRPHHFADVCLGREW